MSDTADTANVIIRPPIAWALAVLAALALQWLMPLPFMPAAAPAGWVGGAVFAIALALAAWAIATLTRAGSNVPTSMPTTTIVDAGPYRLKFVATKTADQLDLQALTRHSPPLRN
jgi:protein-S-isoprenylcysteine O-methyltransferase Ste14